METPSINVVASVTIAFVERYLLHLLPSHSLISSHMASIAASTALLCAASRLSRLSNAELAAQVAPCLSPL